MVAVQPGRGVPIAGLILKVAAACNLDCGYCYVYHGKDQGWRDRPGVMSAQTLEHTLDRARAYCEGRPGSQLSICLHGGEPLLIGRERFAGVVERIRARLGPHLGSISVQTNGLLVDAQWAALLKALRVSVSLSLDGTQAVHDAARPDHKGRGSFARAVSGYAHLRAAGVRVPVLCVVSPGACGASAYRALRAVGADQLDFLLPDVSHDDHAARFARYGATPVADYLIPAFDAWLAEDDPAVEVRFFGDLVRLALGDLASTDAFGGGPSAYLVIETDGTIEANDALRVCEAGLGHTGLDVRAHGFDAVAQGRPIAAQVIAGGLPLPAACHGCAEARTCAGGYLPHRFSRARGFDNPSVWCADILALFAHVRAVLLADAAAA